MTLLTTYTKRFLPIIEADLKNVLANTESYPDLYYRMLHYHMGWVDETGAAIEAVRGKRIRPMLALLASEAVCGDYNPGRPPAAAVELIHNFSLLHDDIQDKSPTRRNRSTVWTIWGEPQAINAGDALYTLAYLSIPRLSDEVTATTANMFNILGDVCLELTRGQHLDMTFEARDEVSTEEYLSMIRGKTAALLGGAVQLGATAGGADQQTQESYQAFGHHLGMAFQVLDDILDIWGDPDLTGKEAAIDIRQRKKSLPVLFGLARSEELRTLYGSPGEFGETAIQHVIALLEETGAREYAKSLAEDYSEKTLKHLEEAHPQREAAQALRDVVGWLLNRKH